MEFSDRDRAGIDALRPESSKQLRRHIPDGSKTGVQRLLLVPEDGDRRSAVNGQPSDVVCVGLARGAEVILEIQD